MTTQRTPEWFEERLGRVTASRIGDVMAKGKGTAESASRRNYRVELALQRVTKVVIPTYESRAMRDGTEREAMARVLYELGTDLPIVEVGCIPHPFIPWCGASPDGLVGDDGLLEIKAPMEATHLDTLIGGDIDTGYQLQMIWQMECTGRQWVDFVSFNPNFPPELMLHIRRFRRDAARALQVTEAVTAFLVDVDATEQQIRTLLQPTHERKTP